MNDDVVTFRDSQRVLISQRVGEATNQSVDHRAERSVASIYKCSTMVITIVCPIMMAPPTNVNGIRHRLMGK